MDEFELYAILIVLALLFAGWIVYQLVVGATYVLTAILGVLYVICAALGAAALAGLDMLLCPPRFAVLPFIAWAAWGAVAGGFLGFWTVAPVYKLRHMRRLIMFAPLLLALVAMALRLTVAPAPQLALAAAAPAASTQVPGTYVPATLELPVRYLGSAESASRQQANRDLIFEVQGRRYPLPLDSGRHPAGGITIPLPPLPQAGGGAPMPMLSVLIEPKVSGGAIGDTTYWKDTADNSAGLVASVRDSAGRIYFTIVVQPDGQSRFVDGVGIGSAGPNSASRTYTVSMASGLRGMGRLRGKVTASFKFSGISQDNSGWVLDSYNNYWPRFEFPEGTFYFTLQAPGA